MRADPAFFLHRGAQIVREHGAGLPHDPIIAGLRICTKLKATPAGDDEAVPVGVSRFGGRPDLPGAVPWPRWEGVEEPEGELREFKPTPLAFLAQLNLAEIPDGTGLLPETGWLYFFYEAQEQPWGFDPRHAGGSHVAYFAGDTSALVRRDCPEELDDDGIIEPSLLTSELAPTLPRWDHQLGLDLPQAASDTYSNLAETIIAGREPHHRLFGWPKQIQGEMDLECQLVTNGIYCGNPDGYASERAKQLETGAADWIMLLQLDTDEDGAGWWWGDSGCLYFWIRKQDLAARRFDNAWAILQCY